MALASYSSVRMQMLPLVPATSGLSFFRSVWTSTRAAVKARQLQAHRQIPGPGPGADHMGDGGVLRQPLKADVIQPGGVLVVGVVDVVDIDNDRLFLLQIQQIGDGLVKGDRVLVFGQDHQRLPVRPVGGGDGELVVALPAHLEGGDAFDALLQGEAQLTAGSRRRPSC